MSLNNPKFSIVCPSYNHEKYVSAFINSVLKQTYQDFELIIVDDCSTDKNIKCIKSFDDSRIKLIQHEYNKGINSGLNTAFENLNGEFFVFIASDDMLKPNYLETMAQTFSQNEGINAIYCNLNVIDENNNLREDYPDGSLPFVENKSRIEFLNEAFLSYNPLYSPGLCIKKECIEKIFPFPSGNIMYQDYRMNVQLLLMGNIIVLPDKLVNYRIERVNRKSICGVNLSYSRDDLEVDNLMDLYLSIKDIEFLKQIFVKQIEETGIEPYEDTIRYFLGRMALLSPVKSRKIWGYHQVMQAFTENQENLYKKYNFTFKDYLGLIDYFKEPKNQNIKKLKWYQKIFSVYNTDDKTRKVFCILGLKLKFKN